MTREDETTTKKQSMANLAAVVESDALAFMTQVPDEDEPALSEAVSKKAPKDKDKKQPLPQLRNPQITNNN